LSWEEIEAVCQSALKHYRTHVNDPIIDSLSEYFTRAVFETIGAASTEEIPIRRLAQIMDQGLEAIDLLLTFSGADAFQDEETLLENNCITKKFAKVNTQARLKQEKGFIKILQEL